MATLTVLVLVIGLVVSFSLLRYLMRLPGVERLLDSLCMSGDDAMHVLMLYLLLDVLLALLALALGCALFWDLYRKTYDDFDLKAGFLSALSFLFLSSLFCLVFRWRHSERSGKPTAPSHSRTVRFGIELLSLGASVLGILSFYLTHLAK